MLNIRSLVVIFCFQYSLGFHKVPCYTDLECILNSVIDRVHPWFMEDIRGLEPSDPLKIDTIVVDLPNINYKLYNASLVGLKHCQFVILDNTRIGELVVFDSTLDCPDVTLLSEYEVNGVVDSVPVSGKGMCKISYEIFRMIYKGKNKKVKDDDGKLHVKIEDYTIKAIIKGVKSADYRNLVFRDNKTNDSRMKLLEQITRETVMDVFMHKNIQNLKNFHKKIPIEDMHYKYVL